MFKKIFLGLLISGLTMTTLNASNVKSNVVTMGEVSVLKTELSKMTTTQLEQKVEECSQKGTMPFEMGIELIKRWSAEV